MDGQKVEQGQVFVEWDPYTFSILTEEPGTVKFKDILEGITVHEEVDEVTGLSRRTSTCMKANGCARASS